jgi:histidyl-tRNA synthetase
MQFDADIVGTPGVAADAEMAMMMADTLEALGIARGDYVIRVNNRKVLDGVLEAIGVVEPEQKLAALRALDTFDKFGAEGVRQRLGKGRLDESGDYVEGAGLDNDQIDVLLAMVKSTATSSSDPTEDEIARRRALPWEARGEKLAWGLPLYPNYNVLQNPHFADGTHELAQIQELCIAAGYKTDRIRIDPSVVRGLEYYTGPVYEAELTFPVVNEDGETVRFGSVAGGGRYDGLVSRFRGESVPATGFSIGVSRLTTALKNLGKLDASDVIAPVVVLVMDRDTEALGRYQKMVSALRAANIRAEMYLGGSGMKAQMKYADRRGSPCVVIQGGDERAKNEVQIKDLVEGARLSAEIEDNTEWRESRPAQFSVPESELVEAVRRVIEAQAADRAQG